MIISDHYVYLMSVNYSQYFPCDPHSKGFGDNLVNSSLSLGLRLCSSITHAVRNKTKLFFKVVISRIEFGVWALHYNYSIFITTNKRSFHVIVMYCIVVWIWSNLLHQDTGSSHVGSGGMRDNKWLLNYSYLALIHYSIR